MPQPPLPLEEASHPKILRPLKELLGAFYAGLGLRKKITLFVAVILFLAISAVGYFSFSIAADQVVSKVIESQQGLVRQVGSSVDQVLTDISDISSLIVIDASIQNNLTTTKTEIAAKINAIPSTTSESSILLDKLMVTKSFIAMITIYGFNEIKYSIGTGYTGSTVVPFSEFQKNPLYQKAIRLNGAIGFENFVNNPVLIYDNRISRIIMYRAIKNLNNYSNIGILLIWLNESKIRSIYQRNVPQEGSISIIDQNGTVISSSQPDWIRKNLFTDRNTNWELKDHTSQAKIIAVNNQKMLLTFTTLESVPWKVVILTPTAILTEKVKNITLVIFGVAIFSYVLLLMFSSFITRMITTPLQELLSSFKKVEAGDFSQQVDFSSGDEIGELGRGYNLMIARTRDLIERVYVLQIREKEAELKALQAQINPHFLYNTLDTIFWKANKHQAPEISEMVYALSRIFRLSLNRGRELTTVAQEEELIQYYLALQKIRFKEKLRTVVAIDPQIRNLPIPKLILQPFVENAIIHGIETKMAGGEIAINGRLEAERMVFEICDDGIGMDEETIRRIMVRQEPEAMSPTAVSGGYAIHNVIERLELYYSSHYQLTFNSRPGAGTTITIVIPCQLTIDKDLKTELGT